MNIFKASLIERICVFVIATIIFNTFSDIAVADYKKAKEYYEKGAFFEAFEEAKKSADRNDPDALNLLGLIYFYGQGTEIDHEEGIQHFHMAAELGSGKALLNLGHAFKDEKFSKYDLATSVQYFKRATDFSQTDIQGDAHLALGFLLYFNQIETLDAISPEEHFIHSQELGNLEAMKVLGHLSKNAAERLEWYMKASNRGDPEAQYFAGEMLFHGRGVASDQAQGIKLLEMSASHDHLEANEELGVIYGFNYLTENNFKKSELYLQRSVELGSVTAAVNLGTLYRSTARYDEAITLLEGAVGSMSLAPDTDAKIHAQTIRALAAVQLELGAYVEAEMNYIKALSMALETYGDGAYELVNYYADLGALYSKISVNSSAKEYLEKAFGLVKPEIDEEYYQAVANNYATFLSQTGSYEKAENIFNQLINGLNSGDLKMFDTVGAIFKNMGDLQVRMNKPLHAQDSYNKALELNTKFYGHIHDDNARIFKSLAALSTSKNDYLVTLKNYNEALKILSHIHSTAHPEMINTILEISKYHRLLGDTNAELISLLSFNAQMQQVQNYGRFQLVSSVEDMTFHQAHERLLKLLYERPDKNLEVFEVVQTTTHTKLANDLNFSFAAQDPDKGSVLNNLREKRAILKNLLFRLSLENAKDMNKITSLREEIKLIEANLSSSFPGYSELVNPQPLSLSDTWDLLGLNEGLFTFVSDEETEATYAFMVTKDDARAYKVDLSKAQIAEIVRTLRSGIDLSNSFGIGDLPNFDMNFSYHLYSSLFGPAEDMLNGVEHLLVVPTGPLESLPLNLLVTEEPEIDPAASVFDNYQAAAWLPKSYSLTRLPSVSSLRALRVFAAAGEAKEPFIGFGDPILNGDAGDLRGLELASVYRGTTADIDQVRNLPELPDTADELKRIAQYLRASDDKIYLRERATETVLKNTDLTNSRVVAFATHGLVGGEISGLAEPALVLSPPDEATEEDDGLLKASEVAQLKMNADIIMLSACNTASGDELGAEGLSGLARAFIYAGARSLLVSHWSVESTSAAELTTGMFDAMSADKSIGRSEALQMSMVDLMTDKERSYYSHPAFWAPFSLVGDGATLN